MWQLFIIIALSVFLWHFFFKKCGHKSSIPSVPSVDIISPGTGFIEAYKDSAYLELMKKNFTDIDKQSDVEKKKFIAYLTSVFYLTDPVKWSRLTKEQLRGVYRSLVFYYITDPQPDGGWYGQYWSRRIRDDGPNLNKKDFSTNSSAVRNETFLFDQKMTRHKVTHCPGYQQVDGYYRKGCPPHASFFGNRIFVEPMQSSLRRGMRNSMGRHTNDKYGTGGFPSDALIEALVFPQEHGNAGWPNKCVADKAMCEINNPHQYGKMKPQWLYFSQGNGMFFNLGKTAHCFSYVDLLLNAPKEVGWNSGFSGVCDGKGMLGDGAEHDPEDPVWSMKLILEFLSRSDVAGACNSKGHCQNGIIDVRTGLRGIGYCSPSSDGSCPRYCKVDQSVTSRGDALCKQVADLMGIEGSYWDPYAITRERGHRLDKSTGTRYGDGKGSEAWMKCRQQKNPIYPKRKHAYGYHIKKDNRSYITGWCNGTFWGFPKGKYIGRYPNPYPEGIPSTVNGKTFYGRPNTREDPFIYYDAKGNKIYETYHGKPLKMDEETALRLVAEIYSCGDTGFEQKKMNWPFMTGFGFGQSLGSPGKALVHDMSKKFGIKTVQFTMTPTSFSPRLIGHPYDFEILYMPSQKSRSKISGCHCQEALSVDILACDDDLRFYCSLNKGSNGGFIRPGSDAYKSAKPFDGSKMKATNYQMIGNQFSFTPTKLSLS